MRAGTATTRRRVTNIEAPTMRHPALAGLALAGLALAGLAACAGDSITTATLASDAALTAGANGSAASAAASNTVVVSESDISRQPENTPPARNWVLYSRAAGTGAFVAGPGTPPLGIGSVTLATPTSADKVQLFNYDHVGTPLSQVGSMSYYTYRTTGTLQQVTAINVEVDVNGAAPGGFTTLVFEPVSNTTQGTVVNGQWQYWDAYDGGNAIWWSSNPIPGAPNRDTFVSWRSIVQANPDAVIVGGFGLNQGSGNAALVSSVDALHFDTPSTNVTYDFEPYHVATSKDGCKDDGWRTLRRADGSTFRNQGDCVSYTNNGK
jgi:hypothetical protein